jgi:hypothetical protein
MMMLKLIINNTHHAQERLSQRENHFYQIATNPPESPAIATDIREISKNIFVFRAQDIENELGLEMYLELKQAYIHDNQNHVEAPLEHIISGDFPYISIDKFDDLILCDEYLHGALMVIFQMSLLEQLLLFCEENKAAYIVLNFCERTFDYLNIFRRFSIFEKQINHPHSERIQITIPADAQTYDDVVDFIDEFKVDFCRVLWREQKRNFSLRQYLKSHSVFKF